MATIDLIVLGILKRESLSAYDIQKLVEYRNISKWVKISTPSIYKKVLQLEEKGFIKTQEDLKYVRKLLKKYGLEDLPILDPTDRFKIIEEEPDIHLLHRHPSLLGKI